MILSNSKSVFHCVITLLVAIVISNASAQEVFQLKGDREMGSRFRPVEAQSNIPFNKTYDELSDQQKDLFKATYGGLKESEKPPFPIKGMQAIYKPIIKAHNDIRRGGNLLLVAIVDKEGKVENVSIYETPSDDMASYASNVLFNTKFEAATCDGTPCKMEFPFEFKLRNLGKDHRKLN